LLSNTTLQEQIHQANVSVHRFEAKYYEILHPEVYGKDEQKRITATLNALDNQIVDNHKNALDVGAGTGNLTGKLLQMGYRVTAIDISAEMCAILSKKYAAHLDNDKLTIVNSPIEDLTFDRGEFDLITCYSVLHHLPDYIAVLRSLCGFQRKGGVMYIDHEASPFYWSNESSKLASFIKDIYFHSNPLFNSLYFQIIGLKVPLIDYTLSDYWHKREHALNHNRIEDVFEDEGFEVFKRRDYHLGGTWIPNPLFCIYRFVCRPEMSFWIAVK
jgi:ubiquinone/menaquinone biosynthesis C-methylase UbiE